jgi:hypothetical protein
VDCKKDLIPKERLKMASEQILLLIERKREVLEK